MDFSKITDEELMWEAKKRFAIPIYYNKQEAEKKIREKDDTFKGMSDDEWDNFKDDFNTGESDQDQLDKIFHDVAYFRFYDGTQVSPSQIAIDAANEYGGDALECEICGDECVDYDDKLCHECYHKSVGADECWCASYVDDCLTDRARDALKRFAEKEERRRCIDCDDDVRTKEAFWGCEICGLNTCEECCENDDGYVRCAGCVEKEDTPKQQAPKCLTDGCECEAAKNKYYPNSEGGEFWTLCEKCYEEDQEEEDNEDSPQFNSHEAFMLWFNENVESLEDMDDDAMNSVMRKWCEEHNHDIKEDGVYNRDIPVAKEEEKEETHKKKKKKKKRKRLVIVDK